MLSEKRLKIIMLLTAGHMGGIETLCMDYARYSRHDSLVLILWGDGHVDELMKTAGIRVINLHASRRNVPDTIRKVMGIVREEKADVLIAQHEAAISHLCLMRAKKLFPDIHTIAYAHLNAYDMIRGGEKKRLWLRKAILGGSLKRADDVVAISRSVRDSLLDILNTPEERISVIYNGTDLNAFPYTERAFDDDMMNIIYTGRLIREKGVQTTLYALSLIGKAFPFHFKIVGDGPYRPELEDLTLKLGLTECVEFMGSRDNVPELLRDAQIFVHMPVWEEGFGIAVVEAMSSGCVCVCARSGAMPELIDDHINGFLVDKENPEQLAVILTQIHEMIPGEKKSIGSSAHEKAGLFSIERFVSNLDSLAERT